MKNFIQIALIIILSVLLLNQCRVNIQQKKSNKVNQLSLIDTVEYYTNKIGLEVAEKQTLVGTNKELKQLFEAEKKESEQFKESSKKWRKLYNATKLDLEFKIDSLTIEFKKPIKHEFSRYFEKQTKDYFIKGQVNQFGFNFDFRAKTKITAFTGIKNTGLFDSENRTEITSSNQYLRVLDLDNFNFQPKKKPFGLSVFLGYVITPDFKIQPGVGAGISYSLFRF